VSYRANDPCLSHVPLYHLIACTHEAVAIDIHEATPAPDSPTDSTIEVSGRLGSQVSAGTVSASADVSRADLAAAIPVSSSGIFATDMAQIRTGTIEPDGAFSIDIPTGEGSWIVIAVDSDAVGFDKVVGHMVVDEDTARLHTLPLDSADSDVSFGNLSFDSTASEFVSEYAISAYSAAVNVSVEELREIARTDSMSRLAINLYVNYSPSDYWSMMTWPTLTSVDTYTCTIRMRNKESMQQKKRSYSDELKSEAVKMVNEQGLSQQEAGRRLSIPKGTIASWIAAAKSGTGRSRPGDPSVAELAAENQRLRKELNEARMEREILKKAAAYFAKESLPGTRS
jgi:transposase